MGYPDTTSYSSDLPAPAPSSSSSLTDRESLTDRDHSSALSLEQLSFSRREFIFSCIGAGLIAGLPEAAPATEPPVSPAQISREARLALLDQISAEIDKGGESSARLAQMPVVSAAAERYRAALKEATDLTPAEIARATEVVYMKINMTHFSSGLDSTVAEDFLNRCAVDFYRDLHGKLISMKETHPQDSNLIEAALSRIHSDIYWSSNHHLSGIARHCGAFVGDLLLDPERCYCISQIQSHMRFDHQQQEFHLELLDRCQNRLPPLMRDTLSSLLQAPPETARSKAVATLEFATLARATVERAYTHKALSPEEHSAWDKRLKEDIEGPLFEKLVAIHVAASSEKPATPPGKTSFNPLSAIRIPDKSADTLIPRMGAFINGMELSHIELGNQFMESYRQHAEKHSECCTQRIALAPLLVYLAPDPELKDPLVKDMRTILLAAGEPLTDSTSVSSILGALLLSDHTYAATAGDAGARIGTASHISYTLLSQGDPGPIRKGSLTPAELLLIDLACAGPGGDGGRALNRGKVINPDQQQALAILAEQSLIRLALDIYHATPREVFQPKPDISTLDVIHIPQQWGAETVRLRTAGRESDALWSIQGFTRLADGITARYARLDLEDRSEDALVERLILMGRLLEERESIRSIGGGDLADPLHHLREHLPYLSEKSTQGPFAEALQKTRTMLYLASHGRQAPVVPRDEDGFNRRQLDPVIEKLAQDYARTAEEHLLCSFCISLWHSDTEREKRPLESHQSLSPARMNDELLKLLAVFGVADRHEKLTSLLEGKQANMLEQIHQHRARVGNRRDEIIHQIQGMLQDRK